MYDIELTKYLLRKKGTSFAAEARELGVHRSVFTRALNGEFPAARVMSHLETIIGAIPRLDEAKSAA
jgi:lambda repressor-like predicted transcriptional regulator